MRAVINIFIFWLSSFFPLYAQAQPLVSASIKPLQLIAQAVSDGISEPAVILDSSQDPHHLSLKPSQRRALNNADVILWIGPILENSLESIITRQDASVITVAGLRGINTLVIGSQPDPHFWLDKDNAVVIARQLAFELIAMDSINSSKYEDNLEKFEKQMAVLEQVLKEEVRADVFPPFAVYHNGYQYFEKMLGITHQASFTDNEEVQPGIRKILEIKTAMENTGVQCLLVDPSVNTEYLDNLLEINPMHYIVMDILARDASLDQDSYYRFMTGLARTMAACGKDQ